MQKKLVNATNITKEIYNEILLLLDKLYKDEGVRLIGVRINSFSKNKNQQLSIFETYNKDEESNLDKTVDKLQEIYGVKGISYASSIKNK